jgi:hypothetical protein
MTTATVPLLKKAFEESPECARTIENHFGLSRGKFDEKRVKDELKYMKEDHLDHNLGKGVRPWQLVNMTAKLDPNQPWFGIEYETGYASKKAYQKVINYLWKNHPLTAIDHEGCGNYPCEITFGPVNMETFMANNYAMDRLINYANMNGAPKSGNNGNNVGTHINVSTPAYRTMKPDKQARVVQVLNSSVRMLKPAQLRELFGRVPYGYFSQHNENGQSWIEGKLFNSIGTVTEWRAYKPVMAHIAEVVEKLAVLEPTMAEPVVYPKGITASRYVWYGEPTAAKKLIIKNFYAVLSGTATDLDIGYDKE